MLDSESNIYGLQMMRLHQSHGNSRYLDNDKDLLVMGQLNITNFGRASAALFNGTTMQPFILSVNSAGEPGSISTLFSSNTNPALSRSKRSRNFHAALIANINSPIWSLQRHCNSCGLLCRTWHDIHHHTRWHDSQSNTTETGRIQHGAQCPLSGQEHEHKSCSS